MKLNTVANIKYIQKTLEKFDITNINKEIIDEIRKKEDFNKLCNDTQLKITMLATSLTVADKGKNEITEKEIIKAIDDLFFEINCQILVEDGLAKRDKKWTWKDRNKISYTITPKGKVEVERIMDERNSRN